MAFEELRVQAGNTRLEMCFKCENSVYLVYAAGLTMLCFMDFIACSFRPERYEVLEW